MSESEVIVLAVEQSDSTEEMAELSASAEQDNLQFVCPEPIASVQLFGNSSSIDLPQTLLMPDESEETAGQGIEESISVPAGENKFMGEENCPEDSISLQVHEAVADKPSLPEELISQPGDEKLEIPATDCQEVAPESVEVELELDALSEDSSNEGVLVLYEILSPVDDLKLDSPPPPSPTSENFEEELELQFPKHPFSKFWELPLYSFTFPYFHSSTIVSTPTGDRAIAELRDGDPLINAAGEVVTLSKLFKIQPKVDYIRFGRGSLQHKEPNQEPAIDLYVSPTSWFLYKHNKAMDCENIMNGNSISRTTIEMPADVFLLCTEQGDYVNCARVDFLTLPFCDLSAWLRTNPTSKDFVMAHRQPDKEEWSVYQH